MLSTEKAFDILPAISDIYEKIDIADFVKDYRAKQSDDTEQNKVIAGLDLFSFIFKQSSKVKEEFFTIVAIVEDKKIEEVKEQPFIHTIKTIKELFTDEEMNDFFRQAMQ